MASRTPSVVDLKAELDKLTAVGRTPGSTLEDRKGSVARLAGYRDARPVRPQVLGKDHWESHLTGDELIHIIDGNATLEFVGDDGPRSLQLSAGMIAVVPQGVWHRFLSPDGVTMMSATPFPGEHVKRNVDDPRTIQPKPA